MKKRIYLALVLSMIGLCGCTPVKDSEIQANKEITENTANNADSENSTDEVKSSTVEDIVIPEKGSDKENSTENEIDAESNSEANNSNSEEAPAEESETTAETEEISEADATTKEESTDDKASSEESADAEASTDEATDDKNSTKGKLEGDITASNEETPKNPVADSFVLSDDLSYDYTDDIKEAVNNISSSASNLQDELSGIEALTLRFDELLDKAETQMEMTQQASLTFQVWDAEINSLWARLNKTLGSAEMDNLLKEQRNWISIKEEIVLETLGRPEDGGSIYPQLEYGLLEDMTRNRSYYLATILASATGDTITLPKRTINGEYVDNQGTGDVYSSLIIKESWESGYDAIVSIFRLENLRGTVEEKGSDLIFTSDDGNTKGIIRYGWSGASFEVTESKEDSIFKKGDVYEFKMTL